MSEDSPSKKVLHHDHTMEAQVRARLDALKPPPYPGTRPFIHLVRQDFAQEIDAVVTAMFRDNREKPSEDDRERASVQEAFKKFEALPEARKLEYQERQREDQRQRHKVYSVACRRFDKEFDDIVESFQAARTKQASPAVIRYPDHEFAIQESHLTINWALSAFVLIDHRCTIFEMLIRESNLPVGAVIPRFVDSEWMGWDHIRNICPKSKRQISDADLMKSGYYKVYPPDDDYEPSDEELRNSPYLVYTRNAIPFDITSMRRYLKLLQDDLADIQWHSYLDTLRTDDDNKQNENQSSLQTSVYIESFNKANVMAFESDHGDRMEYWRHDETDEHWGSYVILQAASGRTLIAAENNSHLQVFCNLLEFFNSDGSSDMPDLFPEGYTTFGDDQATAEALVKGVLSAVMSILFSQVH